MASNIDASNLSLKYTPDWDKLTEILQRAKGPDRSMGEFARACNVSPATFTRIVQKYYKKALSIELIEVIVKNADPASGVNISEALRADGYVGTAIEEVVKETAPVRQKFRPGRRFRIAPIIFSELERRGLKFKSIWGDMEENRTGPSKLGFNFIDSVDFFGSITLVIQGYEPRYRKLFECFVTVGPNDSLTADEVFTRMMVNYGIYFLRDIWEPETVEDVMYTFAFADKKTFEYFVERVGNITVNNDMSVILVDEEKERVVKEVMLRRKDGKRLESIFDQPYIEQDDWSI